MNQPVINNFPLHGLVLVVNNNTSRQALNSVEINRPTLINNSHRSLWMSKQTAFGLSVLLHLLIIFLVGRQIANFPTKGKQEVKAISISLIVAHEKAESQAKPTLALKPTVKTQKSVLIDNSEKSPIAPTDKVQQEKKTIEENPSKSEKVAPTEGAAQPEEKVQAEPVYVAPKFGADYLQNPAPEYPSLSRRRGEQGKVMLRVNVSAKGTVDNIEIEKTSGFDSLDKAAVEGVKSWKFVPASSNSRQVAGVVIVPIRFSLDK